MVVFVGLGRLGCIFFVYSYFYLGIEELVVVFMFLDFDFILFLQGVGIQG